MTTSIQDYVSLIGIDLEYDESCYAECPVCHRSDKFSITRTDTGLLYNCFRDACQTAGHVSADGVGMRRVKHKPVDLLESKLRPYNKDLRPLHRWETARFLAYNGLSHRLVTEKGRFKYAPEENCYAFPIIDPRGFERGVVLRRYDGKGVKASTRQHTVGPSTSWYIKDNFRRVVLVEDQISALKVSRRCTAVALLGTTMSHQAAQEIKSMRPDHVTIALDEDAINTAYNLKKWFGLLFRGTDVVHLKKDLKDMSMSQIEDKLSV